MNPKAAFACAINCMDGRIQDAVRNYMKERYGVDHVDMVTEPGPNKILAENTDSAVVENIKKRVDISVQHHGAKVIAVVGHFGCAGNPVEKDQHVEHLVQAREMISAHYKDTEVIGLWVGQGWDKAELV